MTEAKHEWGPDAEELATLHRFANWTTRLAGKQPTPRLNAALSAFQGEVTSFGSEDQRTVKIDKNPDPAKHYSYSYVTLATILDRVGPLMAKHGLSFASMPTYADPGDGKIALVLSYTLAHSSGEERSGIFPLKHEGTIQSLGGIITYARRYCLGAALGIAAEQDDDAMAAMIDTGDEPGSVRAATRRAAPARPNRPAADRRSTPAAGETLPGGDPVTASGDVPPRALLNRMFATLGDLSKLNGLEASREQRLESVRAIINRDVSSSNDMTRAEVQQVIEATEGLIAERLDASQAEGPDEK